MKKIWAYRVEYLNGMTAPTQIYATERGAIKSLVGKQWIQKDGKWEKASYEQTKAIFYERFRLIPLVDKD